ncbi:hypothetical protein CWR48_10640 [Oceanobacillus arenosus]|uniref:Uncharacterized protein n=1 Tax=Oceanobacillus arenosus TaxID=1229153 RepID=A0A3D8PPN9_9BACI|nr:hypothetical protein [Oceanobacillus arenosus]RDW18053.1 hypothetical protein CWR48_10640 [Oceanobacillus arenosus]
MKYYKVNMIGDGSEGNEFRPDIPEGAPFVWSDNRCPTCGTYIMASSDIVEGLEHITDLYQACESRGLDVDDVTKWFVGE